MRKLIVLQVLCCVVFLLCQCSPKSGRAVSATAVETKEDINSKYSSAQLASGKQLYESHCDKCHSLKDPASRTPAQWDNILKKMIPRAHLNDDDSRLVRAYLIANSK